MATDPADEPDPAVGPDERARARVLETFMKGGRIVQMPRQKGKKLVILDLLAQQFEPGVHYPEREVNDVLRRFHPDTAALRRYLVDEEFMEREGGEYWRAGGTYEP